jgi:hypothetical protein
LADLPISDVGINPRTADLSIFAQEHDVESTVIIQKRVPEGIVEFARLRIRTLPALYASGLRDQIVQRRRQRSDIELV